MTLGYAIFGRWKEGSIGIRFVRKIRLRVRILVIVIRRLGTLLIIGRLSLLAARVAVLEIRIAWIALLILSARDGRFVRRWRLLLFLTSPCVTRFVVVRETFLRFLITLLIHLLLMSLDRRCLSRLHFCLARSGKLLLRVILSRQNLLGLRLDNTSLLTPVVLGRLSC